MALPNVAITPIPGNDPDAVPSLWNERYLEIDENFANLDGRTTSLEEEVVAARGEGESVNERISAIEEDLGSSESTLSDLQGRVTALEEEATAAYLADVGSVRAFAADTPPTGSLECDGSAVVVETYAALAAKIYCGDDLNATALFGYRATTNVNPSANRSTSGDYIVLPDLRGEFIRGWDNGRGVDAARVFGSAQADALKEHFHALDYAVMADPGAGTNAAAAAGTQPTTYNTRSAGGTETRPRNIALLYCIKY